MRQQILMEAKRLFRDRGFAAVSINDIIEGVGVTKPTLYHHFKDKEALFAEVIVTAMKNGAAYLEYALTLEAPIKDRFVALATGYLQYSPTCMTTLLRDAAKHLSAEHYTQTHQANQQYMLQPLERLFAEGIEHGDIAPTGAFAQGTVLEQSKQLALLFMAYLDTFTVLHRHQHGQDAVTVQTTAQQLVELLWHGIGA